MTNQPRAGKKIQAGRLRPTGARPLQLTDLFGRTELEVQTGQNISREQRRGDGKTERISHRVCVAAAASPSQQIPVSTNLSKALSPMRDELALWRVVLFEEIEAILRDDD